MKRLHVNVAVRDIEQSVRFYSTLFGAEPSVLRPDYAKWMLEDPRVNFAISTYSETSGLDHLGIQVESQGELAEISGRLADAGRTVYDKGEAHCCYAHSHKAWVRDPEGLPWETFFTFGSDTIYGEGRVAIDAEASPKRNQTRSACCASKT